MPGVHGSDDDYDDGDFEDDPYEYEDEECDYVEE